jgi:hypothetical protein
MNDLDPEDIVEHFINTFDDKVYIKDLKDDFKLFLRKKEMLKKFEVLNGIRKMLVVETSNPMNVDDHNRNVLNVNTYIEYLSYTYSLEELNLHFDITLTRKEYDMTILKYLEFVQIQEWSNK